MSRTLESLDEGLVRLCAADPCYTDRRTDRPLTVRTIGAREQRKAKDGPQGRGGLTLSLKTVIPTGRIFS